MEIQKKSVDSFFRKDYKKLVNFVRMNLDDRYYDASPEDIVQDVVLSLVSKLNPDTQIVSLTAYIYRSLKNRIIDYRKKKQRTVSIESFRDRKSTDYLLNTKADEAFTEEMDYTNLEPELLHQGFGDTDNPCIIAVIILTVKNGASMISFGMKKERRYSAIILNEKERTR